MVSEAVVEVMVGINVMVKGVVASESMVMIVVVSDPMEVSGSVVEYVVGTEVTMQGVVGTDTVVVS